MQAAVAQTWPALKQHFTEANTNRKRQLTSEGAGFHRANSAVNFSFPAETNQTMAVVIAAAQAATSSAKSATATITERSTTNAGPSATADAAAYGYCWSHGLSKNRQHTSATCNHPADGHKREATLQKMMGGNNTILRPQHEPAASTNLVRTIARLRVVTTVCPSAGQTRSLSTPTSIFSHSVKIPAFVPIIALPP